MIWLLTWPVLALILAIIIGRSITLAEGRRPRG